MSHVVTDEDDRGKGHATAAIAKALAYADSKNLPVYLVPMPDAVADTKRLISFYRRFGFEKQNDSIMYRPAKVAVHEAQHQYTGQNTFEPFKNGDTVQVYHGFRDFPHAVEVARYGLSGAVRAKRVYSYESDNNPRGLFVTMSPKVAEEFVGAHGPQAIMVFTAPLSNLEAPVWPGGSYTVQGGYSQYFGHGAKGRVARRQRAKDAEAEITNPPEHVAASDNKLLTQLLTNSREHQALFVGHLNPGDISAWMVRDSYRDEWERITTTEFINRYGKTKLDKDSRADEKLFMPNEEFDGDKFIDRLVARFGRRERSFFLNFAKTAWENIRASRYNRMGTFREYFEMYLWPKQYIGALKWMRDTFRD